MNHFQLNAGELTLKEIYHLMTEDYELRLEPHCIDHIEKSFERVNAIVAKGKPAYGINTGFGKLANVQIDRSNLQKLQENLILSHSVGVGDYLDEQTVKLILLLKINSLSQGYSGISVSLIKNLLRMYNLKLYPCIPKKGSVGASGDLAPLSHLVAPLLGYGEVFSEGKIISAGEFLAIMGINPIQLCAKEGLALINGTQASTAIAIKALFSCAKSYSHAIAAGAMTIEAAKGSLSPFDKRLHKTRRHQGQIDAAALIRSLLTGSDIVASHKDCSKVQDPYCLRCQPQVMGSCLTVMRHVADVLGTEANAVSDNPLIFENGEVISGGNFHAECVAHASDYLATAIAEIGAISERRIAMLMDDKISGLPSFLVKNSGINSGFMIAHVCASALASENKSMAHPASVDSLPTSANQEDHVSMATFAARRLHEMIENIDGIIAIELISASNGIEFHRPLQSTAHMEKIIAEIRKKIAPYHEDRFFYDDIKNAKQLLADESLLPHLPWNPIDLIQDVNFSDLAAEELLYT